MFIRVETERPYGIVIENGAIEKLGEVVLTMFPKDTKVLIISDSNVFPLYGECVTTSLEKQGFEVFNFVFEAGEESKTLVTVSEIYKKLTSESFTRGDVIVALGGGVTGDMAGFAASSYLRGIDFFQVPTSLLAQVDSSVGGKTGVDLPQGKNLVGAFHQPRAVICDPLLLKTLPEEYFVDGMGEVVKYACIDDAELFEMLENGIDPENMYEIICRCIDIKRQYVEEDVNDKGKRMILNFGHTFGHAIEKLHDFSGISHGRAVAIGMYIICYFGEYLKVTEEGTAQRLKDLLESLDLPTKDCNNLRDIVNAANLDKKNIGKMLNLIFISKIGESFIMSEERSYLMMKLEILLELDRLQNEEK